MRDVYQKSIVFIVLIVAVIGVVITFAENNSQKKISSPNSEDIVGHAAFKTKASARGYVRIDSSYPHSFKFDNGERYFPMGDTAYYLLSEPQSTISSYIDSRSVNNFNFIRVVAVGKNFWPFGGTPSSPNFDYIDESQMQKIDWLFNYAESKNMYIELIIWGYDAQGGNGMWGNAAYENKWVDTLVNRYKNRNNLFMWTVTNEFERYSNTAYSYSSSDVDWSKRIISRIRSIDSIHAAGSHPSVWITNTPDNGNTYGTYNGVSQHLPQVVWPLWASSAANVYVTQNNEGVQSRIWSGGLKYISTSWQGTTYPATWTSEGWEFEGPGMEDSIAEDWNHQPYKPVLNTEFGYQYESGLPSDDPGLTSKQLHTPSSTRKKAWKIATAGGYFAAGFANIANTYTYPMNPSKINAWRPEYLKILYNFFTDKTEYWKMAPHLELVENYNSLLALPGIEYVAYFPRGGTNKVNLLAGSYNMYWLNPRTGAYTLTGETTVKSGNAAFTPPSDASNDWVLHLKKK